MGHQCRQCGVHGLVFASLASIPQPSIDVFVWAVDRVTAD